MAGTSASTAGSDTAPHRAVSLLRRLWGHLASRRRWQLGAITAYMVLGAAAEMATLGAVLPFLGLLTGQSGNPCQQWGLSCEWSLPQASLVFATVALVAGAVRVSLLWVSTRFTFALGADLGNHVYRNTLHQRYPYHAARNTSETIAGINKVNLVVQNVISPIMLGAVASLLALAIFIGLLLVDAATAMTAISLFALMYAVASWLARRALRRNSTVISQTEGRRIQAVQEGLGGIRDILIDGTQFIYVGRFAQLNARQRHAQGSNAFVRAAPRYVIEALGIVLLTALALHFQSRGSLAQAIPVLGALALGSQKLLPQLQQLFASWAAINGNLGALRDVLDLLDLPRSPAPTAQAGAPAAQPSNASPLLELRQVGFTYAPDRSPALSGINLMLRHGERLGVIGTTGSGKSTLIDLCMGLLTPTQGEVLVEGVALRPCNERAWQSRIAHVPQAIFLADGTIAENIAFGVPPERMDHDRLRQACDIAQLGSVIAELPQGLNTWVGERGIRLSGGQRQRIGLARALYKQADILVLDEATSALDSDTETAVMSALAADGAAQRTMIVIAHRLSSLRQCDRVIEVRGGTIVRQGSYEDIISPTPADA